MENFLDHGEACHSVHERGATLSIVRCASALSNEALMVPGRNLRRAEKRCHGEARECMQQAWQQASDVGQMTELFRGHLI